MLFPEDRDVLLDSFVELDCGEEEENDTS